MEKLGRCLLYIFALCCAFLMASIGILTMSAGDMKQGREELETYLVKRQYKMIVYVDGIGQGEQSIDSESLANSYAIDRIDEDSDTLYLNTIKKNNDGGSSIMFMPFMF